MDFIQSQSNLKITALLKTKEFAAQKLNACKLVLIKFRKLIEGVALRQRIVGT